MNKTNNGRVDIKSPNSSKLFQMYDKIPANQCTTFRSATEGLWDETILSQVYFSNQNIQIIQNLSHFFFQNNFSQRKMFNEKTKKRRYFEVSSFLL